MANLVNGFASSLARIQTIGTVDNDSFLVAVVFFILLTIPLARFTDYLVAQRERRERAQAF